MTEETKKAKQEKLEEAREAKRDEAIFKDLIRRAKLKNAFVD